MLIQAVDSRSKRELQKTNQIGLQPAHTAHPASFLSPRDSSLRFRRRRSFPEGGAALPSSGTEAPQWSVLFWRHTGAGAAVFARRGACAVGAGRRSSYAVAVSRSAQRLHPHQVRHRSGTALPTSRHQIGAALDWRCRPRHGVLFSKMCARGGQDSGRCLLM